MKNDLQSRIQNLLERLVQAGTQRGLQAAVYLDGELVVNAWAGIADQGAGKAVEETTLFPVFSVTKGMEATLAHQMVEEGRVTYDLHLAEVWPEFAAHGKEAITLRHALNHTAGLPYLPRETGFADRERMRRAFLRAFGQPPQAIRRNAVAEMI